MSVLPSLRAAALVLSLVATCAADLRAQPESDEEKALATALFKEGRALLEQGRVAEACRKLEESQRLDPGGGTLLNVAVCHEREGRTASAWTEFTEALTLARRDGREDRVLLARARIAALEPGLSNVVIEVPPPADTGGLEIRRDASVVRRPAWGTAMPVDPGEHVVSASAPGRRPWTVTVAVRPGGQAVRVVVPPLELEAPPAPAAAEVPVPAPGHAPPGSGSTRRVLGVSLLGVGATAVAVGTVFGLLASSEHTRSGCGGTLCPTHAGLDLEGASRRDGDVSSVAFAAGGAALAAGLYVWLTAPRAPADGRAWTLAPGAGPRSAGLWLHGRWP